MRNKARTILSLTILLFAFSGDWARSDTSVQADTSNGWLRAALLLGAAQPLQAQTSVSFKRTDHAVGTGPWSVAIGDYDEDGILDLAVLNREQGTVTVLLGTGHGKFKSLPAFGVGPPKAKHAHAAPLDGDNHLDLVTANIDFNNISILLGNGDGTFGPPRLIATGRRPTKVTVGEFNRDGILDLAVTNRDSNNVLILLGHGDGTFRPGDLIPVGDGPRVIDVGDFNGDSLQDFATANFHSNDVSVALGNGDGTFQSPRMFAVGRAPGGVIVGDFNKDGKQDLAASNCGCVTLAPDNTVSVLIGNGDGTFQAAENFEVGTGPAGLGIGDFNGDEVEDLAVALWGTQETPENTVAVLLGRGDGTFEPVQSFEVGVAPTELGVGDFNQDGRADLAVVNNLSNTVSVLLAERILVIDIKPGSFPNSINPRSRGKIPVAVLSAADFDAPREVDTTSLTFGRTGDEQSLGVCNSSPEDVNGDGLLDLVCHFDTQTARFQSGDTQGTLKGETTSGTPLTGVDSVRIVPAK